MSMQSSRPVLRPLAAAIRRELRLGAALAVLPGVAFAGPLGEQVVHGSVSVARPDASRTEIVQGSQRAVVNWHSFSVGGDEQVRFQQPGRDAAILNRVTGGERSEILGRIEANGRVFLVNGQGVYFAPGARVDAAGFAASALDVDDGEFMAGRVLFAKKGVDTGTVRNEGEIRADDFVALLGERVENAGLVEARLGTAVLAAGSRMTLELDDDGLVSFAVDEEAVAAAAGVDNAGQILADGGRVLMTARVADGLIATAVNNSGLVRAQRIEETGGEIWLRGAGGDVVNTGTLDASGAGGSGGGVRVTATGDIHLAAGSSIAADGDAGAQGGTVRVVAGEDLELASGARIAARGDGGAAGGRVEVSAKQNLVLAGEVAVGAGGTVQIDPARLRIDDDDSNPGLEGSIATVGRGFIEAQLNSDADVELIAHDEIFASSPFSITATGNGNLALLIGMLGTGNGSLDDFYGGGSTCFVSGVCEPGIGGSYTFIPDSAGSINLSGVNISIRGFFLAQAGTLTGDVRLGNVAARDMDIDAGAIAGNVATGNLSVSNDEGFAAVDVAAWGGAVAIVGGVTVNASGVGEAFIFAGDGPLSITGAVNVTGGQDATVGIDGFGGNVSVGGAINVAAADDAAASLTAFDGQLLVNGAVTVQGGDDAELELFGQSVRANGQLRAIATGSTGDATILVGGSSEGGGGSGVDVSGNMLAQAGGEAAVIVANSIGSVVLRGAVQATGGSDAFIQVFNQTGSLRIDGTVTAQAGSSGGSADIWLNGATLDLNGGVSALVAGTGDAYVSLGGRNGVDLDGVVQAKGNGYTSISVYNEQSGHVVIRDPVLGLGNNAIVWLANSAAGGGISTVENGLVSGPQVAVAAIGGPGSVIALRTATPNLFLSLFGTSPGTQVMLDNTAHTGPGTLSINGSSYGFMAGASEGSGQSLMSGGFGGAQLGPTWIRYSGDLDLMGQFAAANALVEVLNGSLTVSAAMTVGDQPLPALYGDPLALAALGLARRPDGQPLGVPRYLGAPTLGPNAVFRALGGITFESTLTLVDPDTPYVVFQTDGLLDLRPGVVAAGSIGNDFLAQFAAFTPTATVHVEDRVPGLLPTGGPLFTNYEGFSRLPGTTLILGATALNGVPYRGNVVIGDNGPIDVGDQNVLLATLGGRVTGRTNLISTGFIGEIGGTTLEQVFPVPIVDEFVESMSDKRDEEDDYVDIEGEGGDGGKTLLSQRTNDGQMCN